jgi:hypothetical protein
MYLTKDSDDSYGFERIFSLFPKVGTLELVYFLLM